ncbi:hypothetical protein CSUI_003537 [Cystoisospora suis]|uniref:Uncharacterized protein n=1 Tax=Cystoisospora suis TaxID=483139 RepID=A0A2C6L0F5_9APIC|nr:hypothetical protein CSUI_003537 [Cystoisospora suis]
MDSMAHLRASRIPSPFDTDLDPLHRNVSQYLSACVLPGPVDPGTPSLQVAEESYMVAGGQPFRPAVPYRRAASVTCTQTPTAGIAYQRPRSFEGQSVVESSALGSRTMRPSVSPAQISPAVRLSLRQGGVAPFLPRAGSRSEIGGGCPSPLERSVSVASLANISSCASVPSESGGSPAVPSQRSAAPPVSLDYVWSWERRPLPQKSPEISTLSGALPPAAAALLALTNPSAAAAAAAAATGAAAASPRRGDGAELPDVSRMRQVIELARALVSVYFSPDKPALVRSAFHRRPEVAAVLRDLEQLRLVLVDPVERLQVQELEEALQVACMRSMEEEARAGGEVQAAELALRQQAANSSDNEGSSSALSGVAGAGALVVEAAAKLGERFRHATSDLLGGDRTKSGSRRSRSSPHSSASLRSNSLPTNELWGNRTEDESTGSRRRRRSQCGSSSSVRSSSLISSVASSCCGAGAVACAKDTGPVLEAIDELSESEVNALHRRTSSGGLTAAASCGGSVPRSDDGRFGSRRRRRFSRRTSHVADHRDKAAPTGSNSKDRSAQAEAFNRGSHAGACAYCLPKDIFSGGTGTAADVKHASSGDVTGRRCCVDNPAFPSSAPLSLEPAAMALAQKANRPKRWNRWYRRLSQPALPAAPDVQSPSRTREAVLLEVARRRATDMDLAAAAAVVSPVSRRRGEFVGALSWGRERWSSMRTRSHVANARGTRYAAEVAAPDYLHWSPGDLDPVPGKDRTSKTRLWMPYARRRRRSAALSSPGTARAAVRVDPRSRSSEDLDFRLRSKSGSISLRPQELPGSGNTMTYPPLQARNRWPGESPSEKPLCGADGVRRHSPLSRPLGAPALGQRLEQDRGRRTFLEQGENLGQAHALAHGQFRDANKSGLDRRETGPSTRGHSHFTDRSTGESINIGDPSRLVDSEGGDENCAFVANVAAANSDHLLETRVRGKAAEAFMKPRKGGWLRRAFTGSGKFRSGRSVGDTLPGLATAGAIDESADHGIVFTDSMASRDSVSSASRERDEDNRKDSADSSAERATQSSGAGSTSAVAKRRWFARGLSKLRKKKHSKTSGKEVNGAPIPVPLGLYVVSYPSQTEQADRTTHGRYEVTTESVPPDEMLEARVADRDTRCGRTSTRATSPKLERVSSREPLGMASSAAAVSGKRRGDGGQIAEAGSHGTSEFPGLTSRNVIDSETGKSRRVVTDSARVTQTDGDDDSRSSSEKHMRSWGGIRSLDVKVVPGRVTEVSGAKSGEASGGPQSRVDRGQEGDGDILADRLSRSLEDRLARQSSSERKRGTDGSSCRAPQDIGCLSEEELQLQEGYPYRSGGYALSGLTDQGRKSHHADMHQKRKDFGADDAPFLPTTPSCEGETGGPVIVSTE